MWPIKPWEVFIAPESSNLPQTYGNLIFFSSKLAMSILADMEEKKSIDAALAAFDV